MGKFDCEIQADFFKQLERMGNDAAICNLLNRTAPIVVNSVKKACGRHKRTGDMERSVKQSVKAKKTKTNAYITVIRPTGKDANGVRNMEKLMHIEYGTRNQAAEPILTKATKDCESEVLAEMQRIYTEEIAK